MKSILRKNIKNRLELLLEGDIQAQSIKVCEKLLATEMYKACLGISLYLSMPKEINTQMIIEHALNINKRVFIPKVIGGRAEDMVMVEVKSIDDIQSFPKNRWGIPEPSEEYVIKNSIYGHLELIDLVVVPGVAFDCCGMRLGHGKGYYDYFLSRLDGFGENSRVFTVGLGLNEQVVEDRLPCEPHDRVIDCIITANSTYEIKPFKV